MMPLASECCKCSELLVDLLLEPYSDCTRDTGFFKSCTVAIIAICDWILENRPNCHTGPIPFYWPS